MTFLGFISFKNNFTIHFMIKFLNILTKHNFTHWEIKLIRWLLGQHLTRTFFFNFWNLNSI